MEYPKSDPQGSSVQPLALHSHPNNPTLGIPGSAVQTLLELWQPWGCAHSLGSLGSAQHPLGKNLSLISNLTFPCRSFIPFPWILSLVTGSRDQSCPS